MKKLGILLSLCAIMVLAFSCKPDPIDEDVGSIVLNFKANFDGETFMTFKEYELVDDLDVRMNEFNFYISDVVLLEAEGDDEIELIDIEHVDLDFNTDEEEFAEAGYSKTIQNVSVGQYKGIKIGLGVSADLNRTTPTDDDYGAEHPLAIENNYWPGWQSYIFMKLTGFADFNEDDDFENSEGIAYHTGSDDGYREVEIIQPIELAVDEEKTLSLEIDIKDLLVKANGELSFDMEATPNTHSLDDFPTVEIVMNNFQSAFTLKQ